MRYPTATVRGTGAAKVCEMQKVRVACVQRVCVACAPRRPSGAVRANGNAVKLGVQWGRSVGQDESHETNDVGVVA